MPEIFLHVLNRSMGKMLQNQLDHILMTKYMKVTANIKLVKLDKAEKIIPTFAKVNLSIKRGSRKLKLSIARQSWKAKFSK